MSSDHILALLSSMSLKPETKKALINGTPIHLLKLSGERDEEPFEDIVVKALLGVNFGTHKIVLHSLSGVYGYKEADKVIYRAEQSLVRACQLELNLSEANNQSEQEINRLYFEQFDNRKFLYLSFACYEKAYYNYFGIGERANLQAVLKSNRIVNSEGLGHLLSASTAIITKEYSTNRTLHALLLSQRVNS